MTGTKKRKNNFDKEEKTLETITDEDIQNLVEEMIWQ